MEKRINIIVCGAAGRMGSLICKLAQSEPDFELVGATDRNESLYMLKELGCTVSNELDSLLSRVDSAVIIDFTSPESALRALQAAASHSLSVVIGTTGFSDAQKEEIASYAKQIPCLLSANMSLGVNVLLRILPELASALGPAYDIEMSEIHHRRKRDSPSGTALMLGNALAKSRGWDFNCARISCRDGLIGERPEAQIGIQALRGGDVVGIHTTYFLGPGEIIEVKHQAESRENFAQGALAAARWLNGQKPGRVYSMQDVVEAKIREQIK